jgi:ferredoxin
MMPTVEDKLRAIAREFLERPEAECLIGYEKTKGGSVRPVFIRSSEDVDRLVFNRECHANLVAYLPELRERKGLVGVVVKGCDALALRELVRARQVDRSKVFVVGIPCDGVASQSGEGVADRCLECAHPEDFHYDAIVGIMKPFEPASEIEPDALDDLSPEERYAFWAAELEKCIRCDACKNVCYGCYCKECIFESASPRWLSRREGISEKFFFHSVRALHLAGRCIGCGECERVCPAGVRLMLLNRRLRKDMEELFGHKGAGRSEEDGPPLLTFSGDDPDPFS